MSIVAVDQSGKFVIHLFIGKKERKTERKIIKQRRRWTRKREKEMKKEITVRIEKNKLNNEWETRKKKIIYIFVCRAEISIYLSIITL